MLEDILFISFMMMILLHLDIMRKFVLLQINIQSLGLYATRSFFIDEEFGSNRGYPEAR